MFNRSVVTALSNNEDTSALNEVRENLISLLNSLAAVATRTLPPHKYQTVVALIITLVHSRDIVKDLIGERVSAPDDFAWTRLVEYFSCVYVQTGIFSAFATSHR